MRGRIVMDGPLVAIVGAGVAGGAAAAALREAGIGCVVFEKARGPGGRTACRREQVASFDHGAQYFSVRDAAFGRFVDGCVKAGAAARWGGRIVRVDGSGSVLGERRAARFVGVPGMSALACRLLEDARLVCGARVARVEASADGPVVVMEGGARHDGFSAVLVTAPPTQAADMLADGSALRDRIEAVRMLPTWAAMLAVETHVDAPFDGAFVEGSELAWVARDSSKPGRTAGPETWVVHAGHEWSAAHLERPAEDVVGEMLGAFERLVGGLGRPLHARAHRWRYASPAACIGEACLVERAARVAAAGDWCVEGRVEGAYVSGRAAGERIVEMLMEDPARCV